MEAGAVVRVLKDFLTTNENELCVLKSQILQIIEIVDRLWVKCRLDERQGLLPSAHVAVVDLGEIDDCSRVLVVRHEFEPQQDGDLALKKYAVVLEKERLDESWSVGRTLDNFSGCFPSTFTWSIDLELYSVYGQTRRKRVDKFAKVIIPLQAQLEDELSLREGETVRITEIIDSDWYRGRLGDREGIFPSSFVKIIDAFDPNQLPSEEAIKPYVDANRHRYHEYINTRPAFGDLDDSLRAMAKQTIADDLAQKVPAIREANNLANAMCTGNPVGNSKGNALGNAEESRSKGLLPEVSSNSMAAMASDLKALGAASNNDDRERSCLEKSSKERFEAFAKMDEQLRASMNSATTSSTTSTTSSAPTTSTATAITATSTRTSTTSLSTSATTSATTNAMTTSLASSNFTDDDKLKHQYANSSGYTDTEVSIRSYGVVLYPFVGEFDCELSLEAGQVVLLHRYVDHEWIEAEVDNKRGICPRAYINVVVDCNHNEDTNLSNNLNNENKDDKESNDSRMVCDSYHRVLYSFQAQVSGDLSVLEGEVLRIISKTNEEWLLVENCMGEQGLVPINYLDEMEEEKAIFDMDRLLNLKHFNETNDNSKNFANPALRCFDPLCSPDEEMLRLEQQLLSVNKPYYSNESYAKKGEDNNNVKVERRGTLPKDLDSLISANVARLQGTRRSVSAEKRVDISHYVLNELRGNKSISNDDNLGNMKLDEDKFDTNALANIGESTLNKNSSKTSPSISRASTLPSSITMTTRAENVSPIAHKPSTATKTTPTTTTSATPCTSATPSASMSRSSSRVSGRRSSKAPPPPVPPQPSKTSASPRRTTTTTTTSTSTTTCPPTTTTCPPTTTCTATTTCSSAIKRKIATTSTAEEPLYAYVNKSKSMVPSKDMCNSKFYVNELNSSDIGETRFSKSVFYRPAPPAPTTNTSITSNISPAKTSFSAITTAVNTTTTTSSAITTRTTTTTAMTTAAMTTATGSKMASTMGPRKRSSAVSVASSKSHFYVSIPSETGYSGSLHHSYETLNLSEEASASSSPLMRQPIRPAPPVPVLEQFESSKAKLFQRDLLTGLPVVRRQYTAEQKRTFRYRRIHSLKRQMHIKEKMLEDEMQTQTQLLRELDMYQKIAVAKGDQYESLNQRMDYCQDAIESLSDDIQQLQACLAEEELRLEEWLEEEARKRDQEQRRQSQMQAHQVQEEQRKRAEKERKNKEHRANVLSELLSTETSFVRDLQLTWEAFKLDEPENLLKLNVDVTNLFGNLSEVMAVSKSFLKSLESEISGEDQRIGRCFLSHGNALKRAFTEYCIRTDKSEQLLEKYEHEAEINELMHKTIEGLQGKVNCFNMGSILIKPVQRILKYPLILNELLKCTSEAHVDYPELLEAVALMAGVAAFINESKRRKDIVEKYRSDEDGGLGRKISRLTMHSINKKSTRMGQRILTSIGVESLTKDNAFEALHSRFSNLQRTLESFRGECIAVRESLRNLAVSQFNLAENVAELYGNKQNREVERFRSAHRKVIAVYWNDYSSALDARVVTPIRKLLDAFQGPQRLIQKRHDKNLDLSISRQKLEKNKDSSKTKALSEELEDARTNYEALNSQLVEELPALISAAVKVFVATVAQAAAVRNAFASSVTKEMLSLLDIYKRRTPLMSSGSSGDILEVFLAKHSLVCNQLGRFSFSSKTFRPDEKKKQSRSNSQLKALNNLGQIEIQPQTSAQRTFLRSKYASLTLYQAKVAFRPTQSFGIGLNVGDLVGVIQKKDPMGNKQSWFVDNGSKQGFVPSKVLAIFGDNDENVAKEEEDEKEEDEHDYENESKFYVSNDNIDDNINLDNNDIDNDDVEIYSAMERPENTQQTTMAIVHSYDDVAPDENDYNANANKKDYSEEDNNNDYEKVKEVKSKSRPVRVAPPIPGANQVASKQNEERSSSNKGKNKSENNEEEDRIYNYDEMQLEEQQRRREKQMESGKFTGVDKNAEVEEMRSETKEIISSPTSKSLPPEIASALHEASATEMATTATTVAATTSTSWPSSSATTTTATTSDSATTGATTTSTLSTTTSTSQEATTSTLAAAALNESTSDLSPIYEEISSKSSSLSSVLGKFFYSKFVFEATGPHMLSLRRGQVVRVLAAEQQEWWYVQDRNGQRGYVPKNYLNEYPNNDNN